MTVPLLEVKDLHVRAGGNPIVDGVDLVIEPGEALGLAGESGCGKTTTALALMKLLPGGLEQSGEMTLNVEAEAEPIRLDRRTETGMRYVRWRHISLVFQGAMNSLDPVQRVEDQFEEAIVLHAPRASSDEVRGRIDELLETVGLTPVVGRRYAHQLSGGQRQRVMIALALACRPSLVIADEPTTALDVVMQAQVLELLERLREQLGLALILISHDLGVLAETCDRIAVMYAGRIVETGPVARRLRLPAAPLHEAAARHAAGDRRRARSGGPDPGGPPDPGDLPEGCRFRPRCPYAADRCFTDPALREVGPGQSGVPLRALDEWPEITAPAVTATEVARMNPETLMEVRDLAVEFRVRKSVARAVDGVSFEWRKGEILGVVGESGCGKSTLARAMLSLVEPASGKLALDGQEANSSGTWTSFTSCR